MFINFEETVMKSEIQLSLVLGMSILSLFTSGVSRADDNRERDNEQHRGGRAMAPRPAPPKFSAHPPGQHPHGPMVRPHPVRVLQPHVMVYGGHEWNHWQHPEFARPAYYWDWNLIHHVSCIAEDSYGDQYPVTEATFAGFALVNMTAIEDDALDRCYSESGNDPSCFLLTCSHF
jgi:hypothetical protein